MKTGVYVALLRGINLGKSHRMAMSDLRAHLEALGCGDVRTYIQSGNAVFRATPARAKSLTQELERTIREHHGFPAPVVLRSGAELVATAARHPFAGPGAEPKHLHVVFLADPASSQAQQALTRVRVEPEGLEVRGRELFLHFPNGSARSKLASAVTDRVLGTTSTMRNWPTVSALAQLVGELT